MNDRPRPQTSRLELSWTQRWVAHHAVLTDAGLDATTSDSESIDATTTGDAVTGNAVTDATDLLAALESTPVELDTNQRHRLRGAIVAYRETGIVETDERAADELIEVLTD